MKSDQPNDLYRRQQDRLLEIIAADFRDTAGTTGVAAMSPAVHDAMANVPRHAFVDHGERAAAYANRPLSIGHGQTISQPFIVALMTELCDVGPQARVLEIGTGSGYQAAVLAHIVKQVYSIEIIPQLADQARRKLAELNYANVEVRTGDGNAGWPEEAPFDAIIVTAGGELPPDLVEQLKPGGRLVIPIDGRFGAQNLTVVSKSPDGAVTQSVVLPVRFVPLVRE